MVSLVLPLFVLLTLTSSAAGARMLDLWVGDSDVTNLLTFHYGRLPQGPIPISFLWYGAFTETQKSILTDFIISFTETPQQTNPSVSQWWGKINDLYLSKSGNNGQNQILLADQVVDDYSLGKYLTLDNIAQLASQAGPHNGGIALVCTADDVMVEDFCSSQCGIHGSDPSNSWNYIWIGNPATLCPGHCAWPFKQPISGPQNAPLLPPNSDVGMEGMVITCAKLLAGTLSNWDGNGFYQGPKEAPLEAATACPGVYGPHSYSGYPGELLQDPNSGASYNANGANGKKFLLPGLMMPDSCTCSTLT